MNRPIGYTIVEVLTITAVGALLIIALTGLVGRSIHISRDQFEQVRTTEDARRELERTSNIIRSSQDVTVGDQVKNWIKSGDNFNLQVYSNIDGDADIELVHYFVDSSDPTTIQRGVIEPDSNGEYIGPEDVSILTRSLRNQAPDQALFYYRDKEGNVLSTPLAADDLNKVVSVGLAWRIDADPDADPGPQDLSTEVTPRHNSLMATATPLPVLLPPTDFDCEGLSSSSISCSWTDPNPANPSAPAEDGFKYYDATDNTVIDGTIAADTVTYVESGLTPDTEYTRDVTTFDANGETAHSNSDTVKTLPITLNPPTFGPCNPTSGTTVTCSGGGAPPVPPGEPTPTPVVDIVDTITDPPKPRKTDIPIDINGNFTTSFGGLEPGKSYDFKSQVRKDTKKSGLSNQVTVDMPCTIGGLIQVNPSPTPSATPYPPNISPEPTPRYTSSTAPCFTIGLSVLNVFRVDPVTEAISDVSAAYTWWAYPAGQRNQRVNGGTPGPFYELQIVQGNQYVIGITHNTTNSLNGIDECTYLTDPNFYNQIYWPPGNVPEPIIVAPGNGQTNYKLNFYYMPTTLASHYTTPGDNKFPCQIYEARGGLVRPTRPLIRMRHVYGTRNGVVTDYPNLPQYYNYGMFDKKPSTPSAAAINQTNDWHNWANNYSGQRGVYTDPGVQHSIYYNYSTGPYYVGAYFTACNKLTDGPNTISLPLTDPWPHFYTDLEFWAEIVTDPRWNTPGAFLFNCSLVEHWGQTTIKTPITAPTVSLGSVSGNGKAMVNGYMEIMDSSYTYASVLTGMVEGYSYRVPVSDLSFNEDPNRRYVGRVTGCVPRPGVVGVTAADCVVCAAPIGTIPSGKSFTVDMTYNPAQLVINRMLNFGAMAAQSCSIS